MSNELTFCEQEATWKTHSLVKFLSEGNVPVHWTELFQTDTVKNRIQTISDEIQKDASAENVYPPISKVFRALSLPVNKIRVVVLGQDPYHDPEAAVGLCFSVPPGKKKTLNPSLQNIYKELERDDYKLKRKDGSLEHWAEQGCFMLNTSLTVKQSSPGSHVHLWLDFTRQLITEISRRTDNVAWLMMGSKAMAFAALVDTKNGHRIFTTSHPSPFSAYSSYGTTPAFIGSGVFRRINTFLATCGKPEVEW